MKLALSRGRVGGRGGGVYPQPWSSLREIPDYFLKKSEEGG